MITRLFWNWLMEASFDYSLIILRPSFDFPSSLLRLKVFLSKDGRSTLGASSKILRPKGKGVLEDESRDLVEKSGGRMLDKRSICASLVEK